MPVPPAPDPTRVDPLVETWRAGVALRRVHPAVHAPDSFNPTASSGRFRPIRAGGRIVPTMYAAGDIGAALSESVFHDVPIGAPDQIVPRSKLYGYVRSVLVPGRDLKLVSLRRGGLRRLRTSARDLIHTEPDAYPETAAFATSLYRCAAKPDGLIWDSRLHPSSPALMLFGPRVRSRQLSFNYDDVEPLWKGAGLDEVLTAAEEAGVTVVM